MRRVAPLDRLSGSDDAGRAGSASALAYPAAELRVRSMTATFPPPPTGPIPRCGKAIYGAPLGILMPEARFSRIHGDMGNGTTWPFPVLYRVVGGASPDKVVLKGAA